MERPRSRPRPHLIEGKPVPSSGRAQPGQMLQGIREPMTFILPRQSHQGDYAELHTPPLWPPWKCSEIRKTSGLRCPQTAETARDRRPFQNLLGGHSAFLTPAVKPEEGRVSLSLTFPNTEARTINSELPRQGHKPVLRFSCFYQNPPRQELPWRSS